MLSDNPYDPPQADRRDEPSEAESELSQAFRIALVSDLGILFVTSLMLDGGQVFRRAIIFSLVFWVGFLVVALVWTAKKPEKPNG